MADEPNESIKMPTDEVLTIAAALAMIASADVNALRRYLLDLGLIDRDALKKLFHEEMDSLLDGLSEGSPERAQSFELLRRMIKDDTIDIHSSGLS